MPLFIHTYYLADTHSSPCKSRKISFLWPLLQMFAFQQQCGINPAAGEGSSVPETIPPQAQLSQGGARSCPKAWGGIKAAEGLCCVDPPGWLPPQSWHQAEGCRQLPASLKTSLLSPAPGREAWPSLFLRTLYYQEEGHRSSRLPYRQLPSLLAGTGSGGDTPPSGRDRCLSPRLQDYADV